MIGKVCLREGEVGTLDREGGRRRRRRRRRKT
jgi:hypothetical protein